MVASDLSTGMAPDTSVAGGGTGGWAGVAGGETFWTGELTGGCPPRCQRHDYAGAMVRTCQPPRSAYTQGMKSIRLNWVLMLLCMNTAVQLHAQQTEPDHKLLRDLRAQAEGGDAQSQYELAVAYDFGRLGLTKDHTEAVKWLRKAAEQNNAAAQDNLGQCYTYGEGVAKDYAEAVKWYRKAADQKYVPAQYHMGVAYDHGRGVAKDDGEAIKWYRNAAERNYDLAQFNLGQFYRLGRGIAMDESEAAEWFRKSADQGLALAECALAFCYINGNGVPKDIKKALTWYRKAADQDLAQAQYDLGMCYANGEGVKQDYVQAYTWWTLAANQNNAAAKQYLSVLEPKMSATQIAEARTLVSNFKPQITQPVWSGNTNTMSK